MGFRSFEGIFSLISSSVDHLHLFHPMSLPSSSNLVSLPFPSLPSHPSPSYHPSALPHPHPQRIQTSHTQQQQQQKPPKPRIQILRNTSPGLNPRQSPRSTAAPPVLVIKNISATLALSKESTNRGSALSGLDLRGEAETRERERRGGLV